jgi:hypothetical protein
MKEDWPQRREVYRFVAMGEVESVDDLTSSKARDIAAGLPDRAAQVGCPRVGVSD